jgi:hypothetical protein
MIVVLATLAVVFVLATEWPADVDHPFEDSPEVS